MSSIPQLVIAVDGHSSCGKSTFARAIAKMLGYIHIDSGAMYRAVTWRALEEGLIRGKDIHRERLKDLLPGINFTFVPDSAGETFRLHLNGIDIEDFKKLLSDKTKIVSVAYASNALGTVNPVKEIIKLAHEAGAVVLLDAAQALAHLEMDVKSLDT